MSGAAARDRIGNSSLNPFTYDGDVNAQALGQLLDAEDNYWGGGEYIFCRSTAAIVQFGLVQLGATFDSTNKKWLTNATPCPSTANLGCGVGVAMTKCSAAGQGVWVKITGIVPLNCSAAVAVDAAIGVAAAGQGGANSAGKQILGARVVGASTTTVVKALCRADNSSTRLFVSDSDGWFVGAYLSGTGIAGGTTVAAISADGSEVTLSAATTAKVSGSVTATYNNGTVYYNVVHLSRPFMQGAIT